MSDYFTRWRLANDQLAGAAEVLDRIGADLTEVCEAIDGLEDFDRNTRDLLYQTLGRCQGAHASLTPDERTSSQRGPGVRAPLSRARITGGDR